MVVVGAFAAALLPYAPAPAQAAVDVPVNMTLMYNGVKLAGLYGTLSFEATSYSYTLDMCRESSYVPPSAQVHVNGAYSDFLDFSGAPVSIPSCKYTALRKTGTVYYGGTVLNVGFLLRGVYFDGSTNTAYDRTRSATYDNPLT